MDPMRPATPVAAGRTPLDRDLLTTLAERLIARGVRCQSRGDKLLLPAVWRGKTQLTVAVWPGGGWHDAATGEHGSLSALLDRLDLADPTDRAPLTAAAAATDPAALARQAEQAQRRRRRQAQALYARADSLYYADPQWLAGAAAVAARRRVQQRRARLAPALRYLAQRGLSPALLTALADLHQPGRPNESLIRYLDEGPAGGVLVFPIQMGTRFAPDHLLGVQRIFLDRHGQKRPGPGDGAPKQMLGTTRYVVAETGEPQAGACWLHRDPQPGGLVILGEGPETGLACWEASDFQALVGIHFSASGLAQVDAERVRRLQPRQVIIAADRDASGVGERAARRCAYRLHRVGLSVAIALPPATVDGQPLGGPKGVDWLDVLATIGPDRAGALLRHCAQPYAPSSLDATLPLTPTPARAAPPAEPIPLHRLRPTATAPAPPARQPAPTARRQTADLTRQALQQPRGLTVIAAQTGLGKTHALQAALADPATPPTLVAAPTTALVTDLAAGYPGDDLGHYHGRSPDPASPGHCLRFSRIEDLRAQHRSIVAHECQRCPHGLAASALPDAGERLLAALNRELYDNVLDLDDAGARRELRADAAQVKPCPWIQHRQRLRQYPHVAASHAAYNQDHAETLDQTAPGLPPRQLVLDECPPTLDETVVTLTDLSQWLSRNAADAAHPPDGLSPTQWTARHGAMDAALRTLARRLGEHPTADNRRLTAADLDLDALRALLDDFPRALDGLRPEAVQTDRQGRRTLTPLRALDELKRALSQGAVWIDRGQLILQTPARWLRAALAGTRPITLTDATPRRLLQTLATACHPVRAATPNLAVHFHPGRLHGRASANDDRELQDLLHQLEQAAAQVPDGVYALINSQRLAQRVRDRIQAGQVSGWRPEQQDRIGWFGRHDRGQNAWRDGRRLLIWGVPQPAPAVMQRQYEAERAIAAQAGVAWAPWSDERARQWFPLPYAGPDGQGLELQACLATNPDQAAWERDTLTAAVVQAVGRLRPLGCPDTPLEVHIHTHYPLEGHGLWFDHVHPPGPRAGGQQARDHWRQGLRDDSRVRYDLAQAGGARSRRAVNRFLRTLGLPTLSGSTYQRLLAEAHAATPAAPDPLPDPTPALDAVIEFLLVDPPVHPAEMAALALEYAASVDTALDQLAGRLLARALQTAAAHPALPVAVHPGPAPGIPP